MRPYFKVQGYKPCIGRQGEWTVLLDWTSEFMQTYSEQPKFMYLYSKVSHDNTNWIQLVDQDLANFFQGMKDKGLFENTMVIK